MENEDAFRCGFLWHDGFVSWLEQERRRRGRWMSHSFLCDAWLSGKLRHGGTCPNPGELLQSRDLYSHPVLSVCICSKNNGWREMMVWDFFFFLRQQPNSSIPALPAGRQWDNGQRGEGPARMSSLSPWASLATSPWDISCQVLSPPRQPGLRHCSLLVSKINSSL